MLRSLGVTIGLAVAGCNATSEKSPVPEPTGFTIRGDDLWTDIPMDFCRRIDPTFLEDLSTRVQQALPAETRSSFRFHDFEVLDVSPSRKDAQFRFTADHGGLKSVMMYAQGSFDPTTCLIGDLNAGVGPARDPAVTATEVRVP